VRKFFILTMLVALIAASMAIATPSDLGSPPVFTENHLHNEMAKMTATVIDQASPPASSVRVIAEMNGMNFFSMTVYLDTSPANICQAAGQGTTEKSYLSSYIQAVVRIRGQGGAPLYTELSVSGRTGQSTPRYRLVVFNTGNQGRPLAA
jgi:hypothetical protein